MAKQPKAGKVGESTKEKKGKRSAAAKLRRDVGSGKTIAKPPSDREADLDRAPKWQPRYPGSGRLDGKVAIVTGGDSGIGRAVCALFAREGADVAVVYLENSADAVETAAIVEAEGRRAIAIKADVGKPKAGEKIVAQTVEKLGRLDILVNNAGEQHPAADIRDISEDQLQQTFATNIFGMFYLVQAALPHLKKGSAIVNCTSVTMYQGSKGLLDYSATKGAITAFTRSLSENLIDKGIRVNGVAPGPIWTPLNPRGGAPAEKVATFGEATPMKRPGEPNEVAPCFLFLACDDSSYMSGQVLHPNGGTIVNG
ncbi:SDR family oxidoreductase [Sphingopyxis sp. SE2]|jgi:NAD(P)-dependent dehydrogenase (short-subunit alcohol dehydrogenase family)|uniref:SDR family oxidoreductase n=1 Tax=unclassified Sphingopyxis TaxID=2614943 RepID=UPI00051056F0|nr:MULTISPECIES: SDR family oxidoreductase [unclassified Sphingopyxis]KGB55279.1 Short-chain dehydrogenase/reductase SDR [Sphingopyxis sp. LC363]MDT7528740.1 SDR family oxidoreductase [Sphingopyxis sp. SE2]